MFCTSNRLERIYCTDDCQREREQRWNQHHHRHGTAASRTLSDCSDDIVVEELYGLEDFSDLEDEVFLPGDDWLPPLTIDQYDAGDEELATMTTMMDQPLATLAMMMSPPALPTMMDQPPLATLAMMMPPPASPTPPITIPTLAGPRRPIYSPITPSPLPIASPTPSILAGPPPYRPIYSLITPPMVPRLERRRPIRRP